MMNLRHRPSAPAAAMHRSGVEPLEHRIAPAAIATPSTFTYTDGDGDTVRVTISGALGTAEFLDASGGDVAAAGGDLAKIIITKPSPDFAISFADTNAAVGMGLGDNVIALGAVSGPGASRLPIIKGLFTAASTPDVAYDLIGFSGTDFSVGGGLGILGSVIGDGGGATTDIDLKSLGKGTNIFFRGVDAGGTVRIDGKAVGSLHVGTLDGDLTLGLVQGLVQVEQIGGSLTVSKDLAGRLILGDPDPLAARATSEVTIAGSILKTGNVNATSDLVLHVTKDVLGNVLAGGTLQADIGGAMKTASLIAGDDLTLNVAGVVMGSSVATQRSVVPGSAFQKGMIGSSIIGGTGLDLAITGSVDASRFSGGTANLAVTISGKLAKSQFLSGGDATVSVGFGVERSSILPDGRLTLDIGTPPNGATPGVGDVKASVIGSKSTSIQVNIGGKVAGSQFTAGTDIDLTIGSSLDSSVVQSANDLILNVATNVLKTRFAVGSDATVTIGGQLAGSALVISNTLTATVGMAGQPIVSGKTISSGIIGTRIETSDGSSDLTIVGPVIRTVIESGQNATVQVADLTGLDPITNNLKLLKAGQVEKDVRIVAAADISLTASGVGRVGANLVSGNDARVDVAGLFSGAISASNDVVVNAGSVKLGTPGGAAIAPSTNVVGIGSVTSLSRAGIRAGGDLTFVVAGPAVAPLIDVVGNVKDFRVGGAFAGGVIVGGDFLSGVPSAAATAIGGVVSKSSFLHIGGDLGAAGAAPEFIFGAGFGGRLEVGGSILTDLTFNGAVTRIAVDGAIGPVPTGGPGDAVADIIVRGKLGSLTSASLFTRTSPNGGNFVDAAGTITGALQTDLGAPVVGPFLS